MAMFAYNPKLDKENTGDANGWHAEITEMKSLEVTKISKTPHGKTKEKYIVDGFENIAGCKFYKKDSDDEINIINKAPGLWYSFDYDKHKYNFHIVPDKSIEIKIECEGGEKVSLGKKLKGISTEVNKILGSVSGDSGGNGAFEGCTDNHKYVSANVGENQFLMSFNRLWCDVKEGVNHICNNFGQAQFMCYPIADGDINSLPNRSGGRAKYKFELMYPCSGDDGEGRFNCESGHLAYNAPYSINDCVEVIAKGFVEFIELCEIMKRPPDTPTRAIAKSILGDGQRLLELNREARLLEVYRIAGDKRLREFYNIRDDFDDSPYAVFEREKAFPCIFGGDKSPTPRGFFRVENKTTKEYLSGYYPEHDKVKFFGYLEIVEDYFIHSDLYAADVTEGMMRSGDAKPLSKADEHTSGCVRIAQDALDWLVENIEIGTMVLL